MALTILMNDYKMLQVTSNKVIYQGENLLDQLCFIIPKEYDGIDLQPFTVALEYVDSSNTSHLDILVQDEEIYKENYLRYTLPVTTHITSVAGNVKMQLTLNYVNPAQLVQYTMHSSELILTVHPVSDYYKFSDASLNRIDQMIGQLSEKADYIAQSANILATKVPDDLDFDDEGTLHLSVKTHTIGHGQNVGTVTVSDDFDGAEDGILNLEAIYSNVSL